MSNSMRIAFISFLLSTTACVDDAKPKEAQLEQGLTCLPGQNLNFPYIGPLSNLTAFCNGEFEDYPCEDSPNGEVPNCWAGIIVTADNGFGGTTPAQCLCPANTPPPMQGCNPMLGGPANIAGAGVQDCRKPKAIRFSIREKQAIGPKDMSGSPYDADSCIADWLAFMRGPNGAGNWALVECSAAATTVCAGGYHSTWKDDRLQPFTAQDRHRVQMDVSLDCTGVPNGGTPRLIGTTVGTGGGETNSGQELCGLVNGSSYGSHKWATASAFRLNLRGEPPGLIGAGFNTACSFCGKSPFGGILDRCSNSSISMDYAGRFTCQNESPTVNVTYGAVTVFPSSRFDIVATPIHPTGAATGAPATTVFAQEHIMQRPVGAAGLTLWNAPSNPRPDGPTTVLINGAIPANPCQP